MLPPDGESDRLLTTMDLKLVGQRHGKFVFCYVADAQHTSTSMKKSAAN